MKVLSKLPSPVLVGVVREKTTKRAIAEIKNCMYDGAQMIDLHMSCLDSTDKNRLRDIINSSKLPVLALNYNETREETGNEVLVKMEYTVVSGGTERACILGMNNTVQKFPMSLGYCGVG